MQIQGKFGTAICYANKIDPAAVEQIQRMLDCKFMENSKVRIMPDVHVGKGCTIGTTMTIVDKIVPNLVGVDIGCGMLTTHIKKQEIDFEQLDAAAHAVPSGFNVWEEKQKEFDLTQLRCYERLKHKTYLGKSLGTLGGGNHFIEMDKGSDGELYLIIHTGSRNLGKQVAEFYQNLAIELNHGKEEFPQRRDEIVRTLKAEGRQREIPEALKQLKLERKDKDVPDDLCYLYGKYMDDYLHDIVLCQQFANENRNIIAQKILEMCNYTVVDQFTTIHNYINVDEMILRKGAIAAPQGERVLIPLNMRDGCILGIGKSNPEWNNSAPHGAGRLMSRRDAYHRLNMEEYKKAMEGIYSTTVVEETLDEAPMAYKSVDDILGTLKETVDVVDILKPIYNFKAAEK